MAVGAISEADHANSIVAAGRADLLRRRPPAPGGPGLDAARNGQAAKPCHHLAAAL